jgi:hypothetical protein
MDDDYIKCITATPEERTTIKQKYSDENMFLSMLKFNRTHHRKNEYPPIEEQLDMIYHEGLDAWKLKIKEIKEKYPKV